MLSNQFDYKILHFFVDNGVGWCNIGFPNYGAEPPRTFWGAGGAYKKQSIFLLNDRKKTAKKAL